MKNRWKPISAFCGMVALSFLLLSSTSALAQKKWEKIIDNGQPGYSETGKAWATWNTGGYNNNYRYLSHHNKGLARVGTATWQTKVPYTGYYEVHAHFRQTVNRTNDADYKYKDGNGKSYHKTLNQAKLPTGWHLLGKHYWKAGQVSAITLDGTDDNLSDEADAMRWRFVGTGTPPPPPPPPPSCTQKAPGRYTLTQYATKASSTGDWRSAGNAAGAPDGKLASSPNVDAGEVVSASGFKFCTPPGKFKIVGVKIGVLAKMQYSSGQYKLVMYLEGAGKRFAYSQTSLSWVTGDVTGAKSSWSIADVNALVLKVGLNSHPGGKRDSDAWVDAFRIEITYEVPQTGPTCSSGQTLCNGRCVVTASDNKNCGGCGKVCASTDLCVKGKCTFTCPSGLTNCNRQCANLSRDNNNCGACGRKCATGEVCSKGKCSKTCQLPATLCGSRCVELLKDNDHCGKCNQGCGENQTCEGGQCKQGCPKGETLCGKQCANLKTATAHCGKCGVRCAANEICASGACKAKVGCAANELLCGTTCVKVDVDVKNCGACGKACGSGELCVSGKCYDPTKEGQPSEPVNPDAGETKDTTVQDNNSPQPDLVNKDSSTTPSGTKEDDKRPRTQGCLCTTSSSPPEAWLLFLLGLMFWRRKKRN